MLDFCNLQDRQHKKIPSLGRNQWHILLRVELVLLESLHELSGEAERAQAEGTLSAAADIVNQRNCPLVQLLLVVKLVFNHVHVDEVAHVGAGVPSDVVGVNVDLADHANHLSLVGGVALGAGSSGGRVRGGVVEVRLGGHLNNGERERVGELEGVVEVHADEASGRGGREGLVAVLDDFHHHLEHRT